MAKVGWLGLLVVLAAAAGCGEEEEFDYRDAFHAGMNDAEASNPSCTECNYEAWWNADALENDQFRRCYASGFYTHYDYNCLEICGGDAPKEEICCRDGMDFAYEQIEALGRVEVDCGVDW